MSLKEKVDGLLEAAVADGSVPGAVALATDKDGNFYEAGFGERVADGGAKMTPDTVVWIASMTKAVTGVAAMQQVERGNIDLDAPASRPGAGTWPAGKCSSGFDEAMASPMLARPPKAPSPCATC